MKRIAFALLATAAALTANSARADTRVSIGVNLGGPGYRPAPPVVYAPPPTVVYAPPVVVAPVRGYWKDVQVKTWMPERWVVTHNRWGRPERVYQPGYYTYATSRVWVDGRSDHGRGSHSYGYSRDHRDGRYDNGRDHRDDRHDNRGWNR